MNWFSISKTFLIQAAFKKNKTVIFIIISLIIFLPPGSFCQRNSDYHFSQIFLQHGLSQSIVTNIIQDKTGFMWFATEDGLNKYNGYEFKIFKNDPSNQNSLAYNQVTALCEDKNGIIWIGAFYGGLDSYDPVKNEFVHHRYNAADPKSISNNNINVLFEDTKGNLWVGTDAGLNKFDRAAGIFTRFQFNAKLKNTLSSNIVRTICEDNKGYLWIGTDNGLNKFDYKNNQFSVFKYEPGNKKSISSNDIGIIYKDKTGGIWIGTRGGGLNKLLINNENYPPVFINFKNEPGNPESLSSNHVYALYEDSRGVFWIGTNGGGLNILDKSKGTFVHYIHDPLNSSSLSYNEIRAIYEDRSGLLWIGTYGGGINLVDRGRKKFNLYSNVPNLNNSLNENIVWSIYEDSSGIIWVGTHGGGLNRFDRSKNIYTHLMYNPDNPNSISNNIVRFVFEDKFGNFWVGTHGGGLNKFNPAENKFIRFVHNEADPSSISHNELRSIYQDRSGAIWIGTNGGGLNKMVLDSKNNMPVEFVAYKNSPADTNSLSNDFVRVIYEDSKGNLWVGTQGGGLNKFDREKNIFEHYRVEGTGTKSINSDYIFAIYEDSKHKLWLGTWGGGLTEFDAVTGTFTNYTVKDGLPNNSIYGMLEDDSGSIWISTNNGLTRFNPDSKTFKNYSVDDGLQNNEFNGGAFYKSRKGEMFFGGIGGFNSFYPAEIKDNLHIPQIAITSFKKFNKEVFFDVSINEVKEIKLENEDYLFSFEFASLDFNAPQKNQYAYKMEGLDDNWITTTADKRYAVYTTLAPGRYKFKVKGSNNDGIWAGNEASVDIVILPPFYMTWWFILLCIFIAGALVFYTGRKRIRNIRLITELKAAHEAQMSLMPQSEPEIEPLDISALCIPASEVGGDSFDYIWLDKAQTKLGIVIADVAGKGMKAAITAAMCSGIINSLIFYDYPVSEIMTRANKAVYYKTERKMFTALLFLCINIKSLRYSFTNAGLNPPLLKSGDEIRILESAGPKLPLGVVINTEYREKTYQMQKGDVIILFTDGITEAQNSEKQFFDEKHLKEALSKIDTAALTAKEIKDEIFHNIKRFTSHTVQSDDMTLIVIKAR